MVAPFQAPPETDVGSGNDPKTKSTQNQKKNSSNISSTLIIIAIIALPSLSFVAVGLSAHFSNVYNNWWGPFPLADSIELFSDANDFTPVDTETTCWPERRNASLHLLNHVEDYVLIEYRTPRVSADDWYTRCPNGARIIMSLHDWNSKVRSYRWQLADRNEALAAEQRHREIERRLLAQ
ncbi:hypothetical protein KKF05_04685 [Patescibacteria group bacterium]|nr:hypothetical protein [Patescibacteria group bacterium]